LDLANYRIRGIRRIRRIRGIWGIKGLIVSWGIVELEVEFGYGKGRGAVV
jgi:hypothetical protein